MHYFFDTTWILLLYCSMPVFTPWMWPFYRRHFPITTICANLQFLLATLTYVFCSNGMYVYRLSKCVLFCMCMYVHEWVFSNVFVLMLQACHLVWGIWALYQAENSTIDYDYLWYVLCVLQLICMHTHTHARTHARTHTHTHTHAHTNLNLYACIQDTNNKVPTSIHVHCWVCWIF